MGLPRQYQATNNYASQNSSFLDRNLPLSLRANSPEMTITRLLAAEDLFNQGTDHELQLVRPKEAMSKISGQDMERIVWGEIMGVACGLEDTLQGIVAYHRDAKERSGVKEEPSGRMPQHFLQSG